MNDKEKSVLLITVLALFERETCVRIVVPPHSTIYYHRIDTYKGLYDFCVKLFKVFGRHLRVYKMRTFAGDYYEGVELECL